MENKNIPEVDFLAHFRKHDRKPQSVTEHLIQTAEIARRHTASIGMPLAGELIGLLHDLGKQRNRFNTYIRQQVGLEEADPDSDETDQRGDVDHSSAGAQIIYRRLTAQDTKQELLGQILALAVCSHHSGMVDCLTYDGMDNFTRKMDKPEEQTGTLEAWRNMPGDLRAHVEALFQNPDLRTEAESVFKRMKWGAKGHATLDTEKNILFKQGLLARFLFSCLIDADREDTADFEFESNKRLKRQMGSPDWKNLSERLETHLLSFGKCSGEMEQEVNRQRRLVSDTCKDAATRSGGIFRLTIPTGGGKTFSSLRFALNHALHHSTADRPIQRIIYLVPFTTIIEQNAEEVRKVLDPASDNKPAGCSQIVLEHHSNILPERETAWSKLVSENWDAPVVFSTMVQFLEGAFGSGTRAARRFHTLANAVIIFDEIQALMPRCVHLFNLLVRFLTEVCGSTVVLCTATQPSLEKLEKGERCLPVSEDHEIYKERSALFSALKRVRISFDKKPIKVEQIAALARQHLDDFGSVLVVVNRKDTASQLYSLLENTPGATVVHLTTGMCAAHRFDVLNHIRPLLKPDSGARVICISTNLIEAGVDISFGSAIRLLAGLDSIAQTAGRVNRHGERSGLGQVTVVVLEGEDLSKLGHIQKGAEVAKYVFRKVETNPENFPNLTMGIEAQKLYSDKFFQSEENLCYMVGKKSPVGRKDDLFRMFSDNGYAEQLYKGSHGGQNPPFPLRQSFAMASQIFRAIDSYTRGVLVPYERGKEIMTVLGSKEVEISDTYALLREAQRYTVNIPAYLLGKYLQQGVVAEISNDYGIYALANNAYHKHLGLAVDFYSENENYMM